MKTWKTPQIAGPFDALEELTNGYQNTIDAAYMLGGRFSPEYVSEWCQKRRKEWV